MVMNTSERLESMRGVELRVIDCLGDRSYSVGELADATINANRARLYPSAELRFV